MLSDVFSNTRTFQNKKSYKQEQKRFYKQQLKEIQKNLTVINKKKKHVKTFQDYLVFNQAGQQQSKEDKSKNKSVEKVMKIIGGMYLQNAPKYLMEDSKMDFPDNAKEFIKKVGSAKGNGMPAEQLDIELSILFRQNQMKRFASKKLKK